MQDSCGNLKRIAHVTQAWIDSTTLSLQNEIAWQNEKMEEEAVHLQDLLSILDRAEALNATCRDDGLHADFLMLERIMHALLERKNLRQSNIQKYLKDLSFFSGVTRQ
tara:strand:- start:2841 stop:3164 length:324 start_codon:yes stop_codon:yes gene_type:complete